VRNRRTAASTTGVSNTTAASRLSTAVITEAMTNTRPSRPPDPTRPRAIAAPAASNRPSSSQSLAVEANRDQLHDLVPDQSYRGGDPRSLNQAGGCEMPCYAMQK
jgi:hypothetical protein